MTICIYDCDYDEGRDNTAIEIKNILKGFKMEIFRAKDNVFPKSIKPFKGFIITGSSKSLSDRLDWMDTLRGLLRTDKPVLGICFGHQMLAGLFGGTVEKMPGVNFGYESVTLTEQARNSPLFRGIPASFLAFSSHRHVVTKLPSEFTLLAISSGNIQAFQRENYFGVQFHPDISWQMAKRLGEKRNLDPRYPGDELVRMSRKINKKILVNFAGIVEVMQ